MDKQKWEVEFDEKFVSKPFKHKNRPGMKWLTDPREVKSFISTLLEEKEREVWKKVIDEAMRFIPQDSPNLGKPKEELGFKACVLATKMRLLELRDLHISQAALKGIEIK